MYKALIKAFYRGDSMSTGLEIRDNLAPLKLTEGHSGESAEGSEKGVVGRGQIIKCSEGQVQWNFDGRLEVWSYPIRLMS